mgnify:FL=1
MDKLMQTLFSYIEENLEDTEELRKQCIAREELENRLRDTLTEAQSALLEDLIRASFDIQSANLEAMFLASYDLGASLQRRRVRSSAVPLRRTRRGRSNPSADTPSA